MRSQVVAGQSINASKQFSVNPPELACGHLLFWSLGMSDDSPKAVQTIPRSPLRPAVIDEEQAAAYLSLSVSTIGNLERKGEFPKKRQLAGRRVGYLLREIDEWLEARPVSNQLPPVNCEFGRGGKART